MTTHEKPSASVPGPSDPPDGGIDVLAELAGLKVDLKQQWRKLFDSEPPPFNRRYLKLRVGYRIRELAHGGLRRVLGLPADEVEGGARSKNRIADPRKPAPVTIAALLADGFKWQGRRFKSLSATVVREITGTHWNGWRFFGLKQTGGVR